jgi:hemolysin III
VRSAATQARHGHTGRDPVDFGMRRQTEMEEIANAVTHGLGVLLSVVGGSVLVVLAVLSGNAWKVVGVSVFVATLLLLYAASTIYHAVSRKLLKQRLQVLDHCAIYLLIAGTYTPFTLDALRGPWGWSLFGVIWALTAAGILFKLQFAGRYPRLSTSIYILMGWLVLVAAGPLVTRLPVATLLWLAAGGLVYTLGTVFYHSQRLPFAHATWHVFVLVGSICHGIAVGVQL